MLDFYLIKKGKWKQTSDAMNNFDKEIKHINELLYSLKKSYSVLLDWRLTELSFIIKRISELKLSVSYELFYSNDSNAIYIGRILHTGDTLQKNIDEIEKMLDRYDIIQSDQFDIKCVTIEYLKTLI